MVKRLNILKTRRQPAWDTGSDEQLTFAAGAAELRVRRILVAVDFSENSRRALEFAVALARRLEAEVILVHVFEGVPGELKILEATFVDTSFRDEAIQELADWRRALDSVGVRSGQHFREGASVHREIIGAAEEAKADMIVTGKPGGHGLDRLFSGNPVAKVLNHAPCPVMVV